MARVICRECKTVAPVRMTPSRRNANIVGAAVLCTAGALCGTAQGLTFAIAVAAWCAYIVQPGQRCKACGSSRTVPDDKV